MKRTNKTVSQDDLLDWQLSFAQSFFGNLSVFCESRSVLSIFVVAQQFQRREADIFWIYLPLPDRAPLRTKNKASCKQCVYPGFILLD